MYNRIKKTYRVGYTLTLLVGFLFSVFAYGQSIPTIGSNVSISTITHPRPESQCLEPGGIVVYKNKNFYFGDTYTTRDVVPKWGGGYDTLFLNDSNVLIYNSALFDFSSSIKRRSDGIPNNASVSSVVSMDGIFVANSTSPGQLVYNIHRTALENGGSTNYGISYIGWPNLLNYTANLTNKTFHNQAGRVVDGYECVNYIVHYCGDGVIDTQQSIAGLEGGISDSIANEQCDPADPNHQGWGNGGCSNTCEPINQVVDSACLSIDPTSDPLIFEPGVPFSFTCHGNDDTAYFNAEIFHNGAIVGLGEIVYTNVNNNSIFTKTLYNPSDDLWEVHCTPFSSDNAQGSPICQRDITLNSILEAPTCDLDVVDAGNNSYNVNWNINGEFDTPTSISLTPPFANTTNHTVNTNNGIWTNIIPTGYGTFTVSMTVTNDGGSNSCQDTFYIEQPEDHVCGDGNIDSPNTAGVYEECDNGPSFGYGCAADCTLMTPTCDLNADVQFQLVGNPVTFTATKDPWSDYVSFNLGNSVFGEPNIIYGNSIIFPYQYTYQNIQTYNQVLTVENNYLPIAPGVNRPTAICTESVDVVNGCQIDIDPQVITLGDVAEISWTIWPDFNLPDYMEVSPALAGAWPHNIYDKTGSVFVGPNIVNTGEYVFTIDAWTINGYEFSCTNTLYVDVDPVYGHLDIDKILLTTGQVLPGDFVDYRIELTNDGEGTFYDAYINDVMPGSLDLVYTNLVGVYPYTSAEWQDTDENWFFEYSGFDLAPGQTVYVNVRGQVREGASSNDTTNCAFTSGDYDCEIYGLSSDPYILKSQRMSNEIVSTEFTTGIINVNTGDYISYRINFANQGAENTSGAVRVIDHMPACVDYVSASMHGISNTNFVQNLDINGRWLLEYNGFDLAPGQAGYVIITGQIMEGGFCDTVDTYTNESFIYFHNPLIIEQSNTTAVRSEHSVVTITKGSDTDVNMIGDDKSFIIQVENFGPNPISNIVLDDIWPTGTCINYVNWTGVGFTKDPLTLSWDYNSILMPGDSIVLYIDASIVNDPICVNPNYENVANLMYVEMGVNHTDQTVYHFAVNASPVSDISLIKTVDKSVVNSGDDITYTIVYQNMGNVDLNSYVITDYWPAMVEFVSATPFPSSVVNFETGSILQWNFNTSLVPGGSGEIVLQGVVK